MEDYGYLDMDKYGEDINNCIQELNEGNTENKEVLKQTLSELEVRIGYIRKKYFYPDTIRSITIDQLYELKKAIHTLENAEYELNHFDKRTVFSYEDFNNLLDKHNPPLLVGGTYWKYSYAFLQLDEAKYYDRYEDELSTINPDDIPKYNQITAVVDNAREYLDNVIAQFIDDLTTIKNKYGL